MIGFILEDIKDIDEMEVRIKQYKNFYEGAIYFGEYEMFVISSTSLYEVEKRMKEYTESLKSPTTLINFVEKFKEESLGV